MGVCKWMAVAATEGCLFRDPRALGLPRLPCQNDISQSSGHAALAKRYLAASPADFLSLGNVVLALFHPPLAFVLETWWDWIMRVSFQSAVRWLSSLPNMYLCLATESQQPPYFVNNFLNG